MHGLGGCGINLLDKVFTHIANLGDGFASIKFSYLDTSRANIDKIQPRGEFGMVKTQEHSRAEIHGSGGDRKTNVSDISANIKQYLDSNKYLKLNPKEFHIAVFSASGGTGAVAGPLLISELLKKGLPVIALVVGDSSNGLNSINTLNTLASLTTVARSNEAALSVVYVNNHLLINREKGGGMKQAEESADKIILNIMTTCSMFLSGENEAIDNQDMVNIINQANYKTIQIEPGLYGLTFHSKEIKIPEGSIPTVARTITLPGYDFDTELTLLHHKRGWVENPNVINILKEENFPLHMVSLSNFFKMEESSLKSITDNHYNIMDSIKAEHVGGTSKSKKKVIFIFSVRNIYAYVQDKQIIRYLFLYALDKHLSYPASGEPFVCDEVIENKLKKIHIDLKSHVVNLVENSISRYLYRMDNMGFFIVNNDGKELSVIFQEE